MMPLRGLVVQPGNSGEIVVGIKSFRLGKHLVSAFTAHYHVGRTNFAATFDQGLYAQVVRTCSSCT